MFEDEYEDENSTHPANHPAWRAGRENEDEEEPPARRVCPDCNGTNCDLIGDSGGGCPSCFGGYVD